MSKTYKGKIITITSMKGGVGKTITTLMLATIYKYQQKKVLVVDLDLYNGDIAFALNINIKGNIYNLCDDMANNRFKGNYDMYITKYDNNIDVLPSPKDPRQALKIDKKYIDMILKSFVNYYDVILIDTNHILSANNMVAFENSQIIMNLVSNDAFDLKSTRNFVAVCQNINADNLWLVLNTALGNKKQYFSIYNIDAILKKEVSYIIPSCFYIKGIDKYIVKGDLLTACEKVFSKNREEMHNFTFFALNLLKQGEISNEKE